VGRLVSRPGGPPHQMSEGGDGTEEGTPGSVTITTESRTDGAATCLV